MIKRNVELSYDFCFKIAFNVEPRNDCHHSGDSNWLIYFIFIVVDGINIDTKYLKIINETSINSRDLSP